MLEIMLILFFGGQGKGNAYRNFRMSNSTAIEILANSCPLLISDKQYWAYSDICFHSPPCLVNKDLHFLVGFSGTLGKPN